MIFKKLREIRSALYSLINSLVPKSIKNFLLDSKIVSSIHQITLEILSFLIPKKFYSQFGEDAVLLKLLDLNDLNSGKDAFFVDVGCGHPIRGSNTYFLYRLGLRGICIDANKFNVRLHRFFRPRDISVNAFVGFSKSVNFWQFDPYEYSTGSGIVARKLIQRGVKLISISKQNSLPLKDVIAGKFINNSKFILLSIDTEGFDFEVLQTNDWDKFRPKFIIVENEIDIKGQRYSTEFEINRIGNYLSALNYKLIAKIHISEIWIDLINK